MGDSLVRESDLCGQLFALIESAEAMIVIGDALGDDEMVSYGKGIRDAARIIVEKGPSWRVAPSE